LHKFIGTVAGKNYDLADLLITHSARGLLYETVLTFDKKTEKFAGLELISYTRPIAKSWDTANSYPTIARNKVLTTVSDVLPWTAAELF
jgi:hypothetical protein